MENAAHITATPEIATDKSKLAAVPPEYERLFESAQRLKAFLDEKQLLAIIPICRRTLSNWRRRNLIPFIRLPGTRRILYHFESVRSALLRMQREARQ